jgi:frataxin-like iron-binding protein CyaY
MLHLEGEAHRDVKIEETGVFTIDWDVKNKLVKNKKTPIHWNVQVCKYAGTTFFALLEKFIDVHYTWLYIEDGEAAA